MTSGNGIYEVDLTDGSVECLYTFHEHYYVMAMTVDNEGTVYFYNTFNEYYASLDLEEGAWKNIISLQSQSYYGDNSVDHALYYDAITGKLYHLFSSNGSYHAMFSVDLVTGAINMESEYVGETFYDYETWFYLGDLFAGLSFVEIEKPELAVLAEGWSGYTTWVLTEDGVLTVSPSGQTLDGKCNMRNYWKVNGQLTLPWSEYAELITEVVVEEGVYAIGQMAFYGLPNLKTVTLAESVKEIRNYAFKNCTALESVNLETVEFIREGAFYGCSALMVPETNAIVEDWAFTKCLGFAG